MDRLLDFEEEDDIIDEDEEDEGDWRYSTEPLTWLVDDSSLKGSGGKGPG